MVITRLHSFYGTYLKKEVDDVACVPQVLKRSEITWLEARSYAFSRVVVGIEDHLIGIIDEINSDDLQELASNHDGYDIKVICLMALFETIKESEPFVCLKDLKTRFPKFFYEAYTEIYEEDRGLTWVSAFSDDIIKDYSEEHELNYEAHLCDIVRRLLAMYDEFLEDKEDDSSFWNFGYPHPDHYNSD